MPCGTLGTYFFDGASFSSATAIYLTSALTTPAPDGYYSQGGVYRLQGGGLLGPVVSCPACTILCGDPILGTGGGGKYTINLQLGSTPGATVLTFNTGAPLVEFPVPDMCTWFYEDTAGNPIAASEYSSLVGGYMEGVIGAQSGFPASWHYCTGSGPTPTGTITTESGYSLTSNGTDWIYDASIPGFVSSGVATVGPYDGIVLPATPGQSTLLDWNCSIPGGSNCCTPVSGCGIAIPECVPGTLIAPNLPPGPNWNEAGNESRNAVMVIPSPPGVSNTILTVEVEAPCGSTWWGLDIQCPEELTGISSSVEAGANPVCSMAITTTYYHVPVDAWGNTNPNSSYYAGQGFLPGSGVVAAGQPKGTLGWHDWIFEDKYGQTPLPAGSYLMESPASSGIYWEVEIGVRAYTTIVPGSAAPPSFDHAAYPPVGPVQDGLVQSMCECLPAVPCGSSISGSGGQGRYLLDLNLGSNTGAAFIRFNPQNIPDRCEWTYDGTTRSAYSTNWATNPSTGDGYLEGVIGAGGGGGSYSCSGSPISNAAGSSGATYSGTIYTYDVGTSLFVNTGLPVTMGPYTAIGTGDMGTTLTTGSPSTSLMVIPKPNAGPQIANIVIEGPCGSTAWSFIGICPDDLPGNPVQTVTGECLGYDATMYFADVSSASPHSSTTIELNDWVFNDPNGVTPFPAGTWPVDNNGAPVCITVTNYTGGSIVTNIVACGGSC